MKALSLEETCPCLLPETIVSKNGSSKSTERTVNIWLQEWKRIFARILMGRFADSKHALSSKMRRFFNYD